MNGDYWKTGLVLGLVVALLLTALFLWPEGFGQRQIVDHNDAHLHMWNLWWGSQSLGQLKSPYTTDFNGYPREIDLTFHQLIIPLGVLSIPHFWSGFTAGQVLVFWQYAYVVIGFIGMFLLLERIRCSLPGAVTASLYFVMSPMYWQNLSRPDSLSYLLFPWIVLSVLWASRGSRFRLMLPVVLSSTVLLLSPYFGAGLIGLWVLTLPFTHRLGLRLPRFGWLGPLTLVVTSFHWGRQLVFQSPSLASQSTIEAFSADLTAWVLPPESLWWIGEEFAWWTKTWTASEPSLYVGWVALGVVVAGYKRIPREVRYWLIGVAMLFAVVASGPALRILGISFWSGWLPYGWGLEWFEFLRAFRAPHRFGFFALFLFALALGYGFPSGKSWWAWLLSVLVVVELIRGPVTVQPLPDLEALREVKEVVDKPAVVGVPVTDWPTEVQYGQTVHEKKMPMLGVSYGISNLWQRVASSPVLNAFYNRRRLPGRGWGELRRQGFGGILFHSKIVEGNFPELTRRWRLSFQSRLGPPVVESDGLEFYQFPPARERFPRRQLKENHPGLMAEYRLPGPEDFKGDWAHFYLEVRDAPWWIEGDFDGDRAEERVTLLVDRETGESNLVIFDNSNGESTFQELEKGGTVYRKGLAKRPPGTYRTAKGKGYGSVDAEGPDSVELEHPAILVYQYETSSWLWYWDSEEKRYRKVWMSD